MLVSAAKAASLASARIMEIYNQGELDVNLKSDNTIITIADRDSHNIIKSHLAKTRIPLLSEEGRGLLYQERYRWDLYWLVDPLDGTKEYVKHIDEFVVCIALMHDRVPIIGVIAAPASGKLYFSDPDRGTFCIDNLTEISEEPTIAELFGRAREIAPVANGDDKLRVVVTRSHKTTETEAMIEKQRAIYSEVEVTECGSSLKFCRLIEGEFDACFKMSTVLDWDVAAGYALVKGVGGKIAHASGDEILFNKEQLIIEPYYAALKSVKL